MNLMYAIGTSKTTLFLRCDKCLKNEYIDTTGSLDDAIAKAKETWSLTRIDGNSYKVICPVHNEKI